MAIWSRSFRASEYVCSCLGRISITLLACLTSCQNSDALPETNVTVESPTVRPIAASAMQITAMKQIDLYAKSVADGARLEKVARQAMANYLFDPDSALFRGLRAGKNGSTCGHVNAKNRYGAYVGYRDFVLSKDGSVEMSANNDGLNTESDTLFAYSYLASCASKSEISSYTARTTPELESPPEQYEAPEQEPDAVLDRAPNERGSDVDT